MISVNRNFPFVTMLDKVETSAFIRHGNEQTCREPIVSDRQLLDAIDEATESRLRRPVPSASAAIPEHVRRQAQQLLAEAGWLSRRGDLPLPSGELGCVVGLDLGGTKLRGALADCSGEIRVELEQPTANTAPDSALDQMIEMVRAL